MDILFVVCFVYVVVGLSIVGLVCENKIRKENYLYFFKLPRNNFTKLCMLIFSPILLICVVGYMSMCMIAWLLAFTMFVIVVPFITIYEIIINSDIYRNVKRNIENTKVYKFLFEERV